MALESEKAKERMLSGKAQDPSETFPKGRTSDVVGATFAKVGIYADQRMGELVAALPKATGNQYQQGASLPAGNKAKGEALQDAGLTPKTASQLEQLAKNPEVVEAVIAKAEKYFRGLHHIRLVWDGREDGSFTVCTTDLVQNHGANDARVSVNIGANESICVVWCKIWCKCVVQNFDKIKAGSANQYIYLRFFTGGPLGNRTLDLEIKRTKTP